MSAEVIKPFELLLEYERRSLTHGLEATSKEEVESDWSGIGFRIGDERFVAFVDEVEEVIILPELIRVPGIDSWVLGLVNVRSNLLPAVDLKAFLQSDNAKITKHSRMMVVAQPGGKVGLVVDEVFGQQHFNNEHKIDDSFAEEHVLGRYCRGGFAKNDITWHVFLTKQLVEDSNFQNASTQ